MAINYRTQKDLTNRINLQLGPALKKCRDETIKDIATSLYYLNIMLLIEHFGFTTEQIEKYCQVYMLQMDCLDGNYVTMLDFENWCKENNIEIEIDK